MSSHWKRPPPSKSITPTTTGGDNENASRSIVYVAIVAGTSASRSGSIWSTAPQRTQTRAGGRWRVPHDVHFEPTKPYFHGSVRSDGRRGGTLGIGTPGWLPLQEAAPREVGLVAEVVAPGRDLLVRPSSPGGLR